jgi:hypothetical protein
MAGDAGTINQGFCRGWRRFLKTCAPRQRLMPVKIGIGRHALQPWSRKAAARAVIIDIKPETEG